MPFGGVGLHPTELHSQTIDIKNEVASHLLYLKGSIGYKFVIACIDVKHIGAKIVCPNGLVYPVQGH